MLSVPWPPSRRQTLFNGLGKESDERGGRARRRSRRFRSVRVGLFREAFQKARLHDFPDEGAIFAPLEGTRAHADGELSRLEVEHHIRPLVLRRSECSRSRVRDNLLRGRCLIARVSENLELLRREGEYLSAEFL